MATWCINSEKIIGKYDFPYHFKKILFVGFAPDFHCCFFCESSCFFDLRFNFDFYVSQIMHL